MSNPNESVGTILSSYYIRFDHKHSLSQPKEKKNLVKKTHDLFDKIGKLKLPKLNPLANFRDRFKRNNESYDSFYNLI